MAEWTCKFCGERLIGPAPTSHMFVAPDRGVTPITAEGHIANVGECLNKAGQRTKHHPDDPWWNGGVDYRDGRARAPQEVR